MEPCLSLRFRVSSPDRLSHSDDDEHARRSKDPSSVKIGESYRPLEIRSLFNGVTSFGETRSVLSRVSHGLSAIKRDNSTDELHKPGTPHGRCW